MNIRVIVALRVIVLLASQPHQTVIVQENAHGADHRRYQNIDPEVILVPVIQCWLLYILLDHVLVLGLLNLSGKQFVFLFLSNRVRVILRDLDALLYLKILIHILPILLLLLIQLHPHVLDSLGDEDASPLRARLRFANEEHSRLLLGLGFGHLAHLHFLLHLVSLLFRIFLDVVELRWVDPSLGEELEVIWELLLESLKVHAQSTLPTDVVHAQEVVNSLLAREADQEVGCHAAVGPENVPVVRVVVVEHSYF